MLSFGESVGSVIPCFGLKVYSEFEILKKMPLCGGCRGFWTTKKSLFPLSHFNFLLLLMYYLIIIYG